MANTIIKTKLLSKSFSLDGNVQHVLKNLDIEIYENDFTVIMGSSGSGKSTLLYSLSGMDKPSLGSVVYNLADGEVDITKLNYNEQALFRRKNCGFIFQDICLNNGVSVLDNILISGYLIKSPRKEVVQRAKDLLLKVGIGEDMFKKYPTQISGGEAQRVGLVRALINSPKIVFADEPTGALNSAMSAVVLDMLNKINDEGQTVLMVTHDIKSAIRGNRILYIKDGQVEDELSLAKYDGKTVERLNALQVFLDKMGW